MSGQLADDFGAIPETTPEQVNAARRYVAGNARDAADAALLLEALGIGGAA